MLQLGCLCHRHVDCCLVGKQAGLCRLCGRQARGFDWVDDSASSGAYPWGWVGERVGDWLELKARRKLCPVLCERPLPATKQA